MKAPYKYILCIAAILLAAGSAHATKRKVLFIGNSYTYTNNMPLMLQTLATAQGDTLVYDESDPGGYTFEQHSTYAPTITKIFSQQWDVVVLQEQSQRPAFDPSQVEVEVYPYAHILDSMIHANNACTQTMFMMTWGHADGDPTNCAVYPPICTYDGMQERLRESYLEMTQMNNAVVAPVGAAWKVARDSFPALWLYMADSVHPIIPGSYLESCVLYSSIFHRPTTGCTYTDGLSTADATTLQHVADKVTMDSLSQWQQYGHYPSAAFSYTLTGNTISLSYASAIATGNMWQFGDGNTDAALSPTHTYTANGIYQLSHTVSTACFSETITRNINIGVAAVNNLAQENQHRITTVQNSGNTTFIFSEQIYEALEVYDASGKCVKHYNINGAKITDRFAPGFYIYRAISGDHKTFENDKLIVY